MKKILWLVLLLLTGLIYSDDDHEDPFWHFADLLPGAWSPYSVFETYQAESTFLIEESNGFALVDRPWVYYDGWSPKALPWELNEVSFNSRLIPGAPIGFLPSATRSAVLFSPLSPGELNTGITLSPYYTGSASFVSFSTVSPNLGSYSSWAQFLMSTPAILRDELLYETRRRFKSNVILEGQWNKKWGTGQELNIAVSHNKNSRRFNDWNERDTQFIEEASMTSFYTQYQFNSDIRSARVWLLFNHQQRNHSGAELGLLPQETDDLSRMSWAGGLLMKRWNWQLSLTLAYEREHSETNALNFSKELLDNDGDMIFCQKPFGKNSSLIFNGRIMPDPQKKRLIKPYLDWQVSRFSAREEMHRSNPLTLDGQPYGVILWDNGLIDRTNQAYRINAGLMLDLPLLKHLKLAARAELGVDGFFGKSLSENSSFGGYGLHGSLVWCWNKDSELSVTASSFVHPLSFELVDFLDNGRHGGDWFRWTDRNDDQQYDEGETGVLLRRTGGLTHRLGVGFTLPRVNQIQLFLRFPLSEKWRFELRGTGKKIDNSWTVRYGEEYGNWFERDQQSIYLLNRVPESYVLTNLEESFQKPQYWQLMFRFFGEKAEKWYFSFSFMAHMGLGETPFGNGPGSNDYLALSETSADPNSWLNNYGRLDGDRAFVAKLAYALHLSKRLSMGFSAKYRDGNPFAFLSARIIDDQLIMRNETLKGEDQYGNKLGPREDYLSEINLKLNYRLPLFGGYGCISMEWFNLIDVGYELSEYVFAASGRLPKELNLPRSIRLTLSWQDK